MAFDWQNIVALTVVAVASAYIARWVWRSVGPTSTGCGSCSKKSDAQPIARQIVSVDDLAQSGRDDHNS